MRAVVAAILGVLLSPLGAAPMRAQVLKGGVQQDQASDTSDLRLRQLLDDMYHTLSTLVRPNSSTQAQFNSDVAEFNAIKAQGSPLAAKYSACVDDFRQAYPHILKSAQLLQSNAPSTAINKEWAIGSQYMTAAVKCQGAVDSSNARPAANQPNNPPSQNGQGNSLPKPQQPSYGYPGSSGSNGGNPSVRGGISGSSNDRPVPCPGGTWVTRDAMFTARAPRNMHCRFDMGTNEYVCCPGNFWTGLEGPIPTPAQIANPNGGGYNPCANPRPPPECLSAPVRRQPTPNPNPRATGNPAGNAAEYARGVMRGLGDCAKTGLDLLAAAASMVRGDFVTASQLLGLQPGQSVALRALFQEATTQNIGISPYDAGRIAGRRICAYAIVPGVIKGASSLRGVRTPGATPYNPLRGGAIASDSASLEGKWIQGPNGAVKLGALRGSGAFGNVYRLGQGKVIKISNASPNSSASFPRQVSGADALRGAGVPTPHIYETRFAPTGEPSFLVMDDIAVRWPRSQIVSDIQALTPQQLSAIRDLYGKVAKDGLIWADGHSSNIFFTPAQGGLTAGVVDADMVFSAAELASQDPIVQNTIGNILWKANQQGLLFNGFNPRSVMDVLFHARFQ